MRKFKKNLLPVIFFGIIVLSYPLLRNLPLLSNLKTPERYSCIDCNVILISVNVLRPDNLGAYGYSRDTSPNIDSLASEGILFKNAFSQVPFTLPSVMSIFTSLYPLTHGVITAGGDTLDSSIQTLTEILKQNDYITAWFANLDGDPNLDLKTGFKRGFDEIYQDLAYPNDWSEVYQWVGNHRQEKFFLFLHTFTLHDPYIAPSPFDKLYGQSYEGNIIGEREEFFSKFAETKGTNQELDIVRDFLSLRDFYWQFVDTSDENDVNRLIALYDASITCCVDPFIGELMDTLEEYGLDEKTIVIITSDHGEAFGEHDHFLHDTTYYEDLHVALIMKIPNADNRIIDSQVQSIDIMPTILDALDIPILSALQGKSLLSLMRGQVQRVNEYTYGYWFSMSSIRSEEWKLIKRDTGELELYDVKNDPKEQVNVAEQYPDVVRDMQNKLDEFELSSYISRDR